jgi:hypothetical protein
MSTENESGAPADGVPDANGVPNQDGNDGYTIVGKNGKAAPAAKPNTSQAIKNRGQNLIETSEIMNTQIKLEFNISKDTKALNPRTQHLALLRLMKAVDPSLIIESVQDDTKWETYTDFPMNEAYRNHFNVTESKPPRGPKKINVHFMLHTKLRIKEIKFSNEVYNFLKKNNTYLTIDQYDMQKVATVGYITHVHPTLSWIPTITEELIVAMQHVQLPKEDVDAWKAQTTLDYDEETDNTPVPMFHLKKRISRSVMETSGSQQLYSKLTAPSLMPNT